LDCRGLPVLGLLNESGIAVGISQDTDFHFRSFIYDAGQLTTINPVGAVDTNATALNNSGDIVGWFTDLNGQDRGFLYDKGQVTTIDFPGAPATRLLSINDSGMIRGEYFDDSGSHVFSARLAGQSTDALGVSIVQPLAPGISSV
jgi:probable HAF family extracellular repeat protein